MMNYCEVCGREVETKIISRREIFNVCGEDVEVEAQVMVCTVCGEELFNEELDSATLINAYNEYRRKHKLLLPEEIRKIREQYGLSQRSFAKLLNWGDRLFADMRMALFRIEHTIAYCSSCASLKICVPILLKMKLLLMKNK